MAQSFIIAKLLLVLIRQTRKISEKWLITRRMEIDEFVREVKSSLLDFHTRVLAYRNILIVNTSQPCK